jgi:Tfp pilus assembly protein PilO
MRKNLTFIFVKFSLTLFVLGAVLFFLGIQINQLAGRISDINNKAEAIRVKENSKQDLIRDSEITKDVLPILTKALPSEDNLIDFIADLENLAQVTGCKQELSFAEAEVSTIQEGENVAYKKKTTKDNIEFTITLEGSFTSLKNYLSGLEDLPYIIEIKKISSSGDDLNTGGKTNIQAVLYTSK